jgi:hypothetical protein
MTSRVPSFAWLTDAGRGRRGGERELSTETLRAEIVRRARLADPTVVAIEDYRGPAIAVPLLLIFANRTIGVWPVADHLLNYRFFRLKAAHRALDAVAVVMTHSNESLLHFYTPDDKYSADVSRIVFPRLGRFNVCETERAISIIPSRQYGSGKRAFRDRREADHFLDPDDGCTSLDHVRDFVRLAERKKIVGPTMPTARAQLRDVLRQRAAEIAQARPSLDEARIRPALRARIASGHVGPGYLISELRVRGYTETFADETLLAPDGFHFWEIKGEGDSFTRLPRQAAVYERVATSVTLVVADCHLKRALALAPPWWGLLVASSDGTDVVLRAERAPVANAAREPRSVLFQILAAEIRWLAKHLKIPTHHRTVPTHKIYERLANILTDDEARFYAAKIAGRRGAHVTRVPRDGAWEAINADQPWPEAPMSLVPLLLTPA